MSSRCAPALRAPRSAISCEPARGSSMNGSQPSAICAGLLDRARADGAEVDRGSAPAPAWPAASAAGRARPGAAACTRSPAYSSGPRGPAPRARSPRTRACARRAWRTGTPYQPSDTCGPDTPRPSRKRPPERTSSVAAAIAVAAGWRAGICIRPEPSATRSVRPASSPSTETASWPQASEIHTESSPSSSASTRELDLLLEREPGPVGEEEADVHRAFEATAPSGRPRTG